MAEGVLRIEGDHVVSTIKEEGDIIPIRLNEQEKVLLRDAKKILEQPKDSTAIKQLMSLGYKCIKRSDTQDILNTVFENKRKNKRLGIVEFEV